MIIGKISKNYIGEVINTINYLIKKGKRIIDTKRLRRINNVKASNRSKINFYWRTLEQLEKLNYLKLANHTNPKSYFLPENQLNFKQIIKELE
jgi:hypothetical protein